MNKKSLLTLAGLLIVTLLYQFDIANAKKESSQTSRKNNEYSQALRLLWTKVYPSQGKTLYCDTTFSTKNRRERKKNVNAEHVFPMSWVAKDLRCGTRKQCQMGSSKFRQIESDLHNIYPAEIIINSARSNYRFGNVNGEKREFGQCDFEVNRKSRVAEPKPAKRGEIARAMLYMAYQYDVSLYKKTQKMMRKWDKEDPPSATEIKREQLIHKNQGRENPYISRYPFSPQK